MLLSCVLCEMRSQPDGLVGHNGNDRLVFVQQPVDRLCVSYLSAFSVVIYRRGQGRVYLAIASAPCGDDGVLFVYVHVCRAGNLTALSGMTRMLNLGLDGNLLTGTFWFCDVSLCTFCCDGARLGVPSWRPMRR